MTDVQRKMTKKENINNKNIKWGSNNFKDGKFDFFEWSAPVIQDRISLKEELDSFSLIGRKIRSMRFVGYCYNMDEDGIKDRILDAMEEKGVDIKSYDNGLFYELPELKEMVSLLRRSSNNLNQIAKRMNETGRIYDADIGDVLENQERLWQAASDILSSLAKLQ